MTTHFTELAQRAAADGQVTSQEILALRRQGWGDGIITREEAEALFAVNNALDKRDEDWCDFFVEAIGEFVLNGTPPRLQCDSEEAKWLIAQVDHDGVVESFVELETIVRIIERAENVASALKDYVIAQIENEVLSGTGPTRHGGDLSATHISSAEVRILRRVIFASGGYGPAAVNRFEAEMLFRLKDATLAEENASEWEDLFLDGISNFLQGFAFKNAQLDHGRVLELQAFIADNKPNVGRFFRQMMHEAPNVANNIGKVFGKRDTGPSFAEQAAAGQEVTEFEQKWLDTMVESDGEIDELERRLIARVLKEST